MKYQAQIRHTSEKMVPRREKIFSGIDVLANVDSTEKIEIQKKIQPSRVITTFGYDNPKQSNSIEDSKIFFSFKPKSVLEQHFAKVQVAVYFAVKSCSQSIHQVPIHFPRKLAKQKEVNRLCDKKTSIVCSFFDKCKFVSLIFFKTKK